MVQGAFYVKTRKRLEAYGLFDDATLDFAAEVAKKQSEYKTYQAFLKAVDVPLKPILFVAADGRGVPLVDVAARADKQVGVLVIYLPMANSLDPNQLYQVATLVLAFPTYRIIAFGNPSGYPFSYREQRFSLKDWWSVAFTKNRRAAVGAELEYLASQQIRDAVHIGYSYGSLKAMLVAYYAPPEQTKSLVLLDPVAHSRGVFQLIGDFNATLSPLGTYVNRTELQTFFDARQDAVDLVRYRAGMVRPTNIAIGLMLARINFIPFLQGLLARHADLTAYVSWGSKSELGNDAHMRTSLHDMKHRTAKGRVRAIRLENDTHAFANDLHLYVALVHDAICPKR